MDDNWDKNLDRIVQSFQNGIKREIGKSVAAFKRLQSLGAPDVIRFLDILTFRMNETMRIVEMKEDFIATLCETHRTRPLSSNAVLENIVTGFGDKASENGSANNNVAKGTPQTIPQSTTVNPIETQRNDAQTKEVPPKNAQQQIVDKSGSTLTAIQTMSTHAGGSDSSTGRSSSSQMVENFVAVHKKASEPLPIDVMVENITTKSADQSTENASRINGAVKDTPLIENTVEKQHDGEQVSKAIDENAEVEMDERMTLNVVGTSSTLAGSLNSLTGEPSANQMAKQFRTLQNKSHRSESPTLDDVGQKISTESGDQATENDNKNNDVVGDTPLIESAVETHQNGEQTEEVPINNAPKGEKENGKEGVGVPEKETSSTLHRKGNLNSSPSEISVNQMAEQSAAVHDKIPEPLPSDDIVEIIPTELGDRTTENDNESNDVVGDTPMIESSVEIPRDGDQTEETQVQNVPKEALDEHLTLTTHETSSTLTDSSAPSVEMNKRTSPDLFCTNSAGMSIDHVIQQIEVETSNGNDQSKQDSHELSEHEDVDVLGDSDGDSSEISDSEVFMGFDTMVDELVEVSMKRKEIMERVEVLCKRRKIEHENANEQETEQPQANGDDKSGKTSTGTPDSTDSVAPFESLSELDDTLDIIPKDPRLREQTILVAQHGIVTNPRPSPMMVQRILRKTECIIFKDGHVNAFCYFCEKSLQLPESEWKWHLLAHTGEMEFHCFACRSQLPSKSDHGECTSDSVISIFEDQGDILSGFMCKQCHFVQIHKSRIAKHLESEHEAIDTNFNRNVEKIVFVPDLRPLTWSIKRQHAFIAEKNRFVCSIASCGGEFTNTDDFADHFRKSHRNEKSYTCPHCQESIEKDHRELIRDVLQHLKLHDSKLIECQFCGVVFTNEYNVLRHIMQNHPVDPLSYRFSRTESDGLLEIQEIAILLKCIVCGVRCESMAQANEHFVKNHKTLYTSFEGVRVVKRTAMEGVTSCYTPIEKRILVFRRSLSCAVCKRVPQFKSDLIEHFNRKHPKEEIAVKKGSTFLSDSRDDGHQNDVVLNYAFNNNNLIYYCAECHDAKAPNNCAYASVADVHGHWASRHSTESNTRPFRFYAIQLVSCFYCKLISSFDEVKKHQKAQHPNEPCNITDALNTRKCALCEYINDDLTHHLKTAHELVLRMDARFNPTRLSEDTLNQLLAIDIHKKFRCDYCGFIVETEHEMRGHTAFEHNMPLKCSSFADSQTVQLITGCCLSVLNLHEFLQHLENPNHKCLSRCTTCSFQSTDLYEFVNHQVNEHQVPINADNLFRRVLRTWFWSTKVIFGNGLVLNKHNLLGSELDDTKPFESLIENLLNIAQEKLSMQRIAHAMGNQRNRHVYLGSFEDGLKLIQQI